MSERLNGKLSRRTMSKRNDSIKCAARYLLGKTTPLTAAECFHNMTFKSGRLYRVSARATTLRRLESRMTRHPVFTKHDTHPKTYTCTLKEYEDYFDDDPTYNWTDNKAVNDKPSRRKRNED